MLFMHKFKYLYRVMEVAILFVFIKFDLRSVLNNVSDSGRYSKLKQTYKIQNLNRHIKMTNSRLAMFKFP